MQGGGASYAIYLRQCYARGVVRWHGARPLHVAPLAVLTAVALTAAACGGAPLPAGGAARIEVVAAESFWGSIASQVGGDRVHVTSIVANPATDPHDYDPTPSDARLIAQARMVIVNGAGYDAWASKLLGSSPAAGRVDLDVADLLGRKSGDNPHFWYSPGYVTRVIEAVAAGLARADPAGAAAFQAGRDRYESSGLKPYHDAMAAIRQRYAGTAVGATESIFVYLAAALGLDLITPPSYMRAISEGADLSAADRVTVDEQVSSGRIRVLVFNSQNSTPDVQEVVARARAAGIPIVAITETPSPAGLAFQDWQTGQLTALRHALDLPR